MKNCFRLATALSLLLVSGNAFGHYKPSPTTPGKYTNWGGQIEKLEIVESFKLADYQRIVVEPLDTSRVPLPKDGAKTYPPVKTVLGYATAPFLAGLSGPLGKVPASLRQPGENPGPGTLVVRGQVLRMDPGAHAPRYSPDGAGSARVVIASDVVDGGTGKTLLRFRQERRSGSSRDTMIISSGRAGVTNIGLRPLSREIPAAAAGNYEKTMSFEVQQIGADLADVLQSF